MTICLVVSITSVSSEHINCIFHTSLLFLGRFLLCSLLCISASSSSSAACSSSATELSEKCLSSLQSLIEILSIHLCKEFSEGVGISFNSYCGESCSDISSGGRFVSTKNKKKVCSNVFHFVYVGLIRITSSLSEVR